MRFSLRFLLFFTTALAVWLGVCFHRGLMEDHRWVWIMLVHGGGVILTANFAAKFWGGNGLLEGMLALLLAESAWLVTIWIMRGAFWAAPIPFGLFALNPTLLPCAIGCAATRHPRHSRAVVASVVASAIQAMPFLTLAATQDFNGVLLTWTLLLGPYAAMIAYLASVVCRLMRRVIYWLCRADEWEVVEEMTTVPRHRSARQVAANLQADAIERLFERP